MAHVLIAGGGFGGIVVAERLAKTLSAEQEITLVARTDRFVFYPALVRLAFGKCEPDDISFDVRAALLDRRVRFVQTEVVRVDRDDRCLVTTGGDVEGRMPYDFLVLATGRRLATERVPGFFEHAHHLLTVESALKFGEAIRTFNEGHAVLGHCAGARLAVPVYETAFALSRLLRERGVRDRTRITILHPEGPGERLEGHEIRGALRDALDAHNIAYWSDYQISRVTAEHMHTDDGPGLRYDLLMLVPPFRGPGATLWPGSTDEEGYVRVDKLMRVAGEERTYAVGDCVSLPGPKMGHMAVNQAEIAAANIAAEIAGRVPTAEYRHEEKLIIDEGGPASFYLHKVFDDEHAGTIRSGHFWAWAKRVHEMYWVGRHS